MQEKPQGSKKDKIIRIIDNNKAIRQNAIDEGFIKKQEEDQKSKGFKGFVDRLKKNTFADYYREKRIREAEVEMVTRGTTDLSGTRETQVELNKAILERFEHGLQNKEEVKSISDLTDDDFGIKLKFILTEYLGKDATMSETVFKEKVSELVAEKLKLGKGMADAGIAHADNIVEVANEIKTEQDNNERIVKIGKLQIEMGVASTGARTQVEESSVAKNAAAIEAKLGKMPLGKLFNANSALVIAGALSAVNVITLKIATNRATAWGTFFASSAAAGLIVARQTAKRYDEERALTARALASGRKVDQKLENKFDKTLVEKIQAPQLIYLLKNLNTEAGINPGNLPMIATLISMIEIGDEKNIDFISYQNNLDMEKSRNEIYKLVKSIKTKVEQAKQTEADKTAGKKNDKVIFQELLEAEKIKLNQKIKETDGVANSARKKEAIIAAVMAAIIGATIGTAAQEGFAGLSNTLGIGEHINTIAGSVLGGNEVGNKSTIGNSIIDAWNSPNSNTLQGAEYSGVSLAEEFGNGNLQTENEFRRTLDIGNSQIFTNNNIGIFRVGSLNTLTMTNPDGSVALEGIRRFPNGAINPEDIARIREAGFSYDENTVTQTLAPTIGSVQSVVPATEFARTNPEFTNINRSNWVNPHPNELRLQFGGERQIARNGDYVFNFQRPTGNGAALMREGKLELLVTLTTDSQQRAIRIPIDSSGRIVIPNGSLAHNLFEINSRTGNFMFNGAFAEVAHRVPDGGFEILSTASGRQCVNNITISTGTSVPNVNNFTEIHIGRPNVENLPQSEVIPAFGFTPISRRRFTTRDENPPSNDDNKSAKINAKDKVKKEPFITPPNFNNNSEKPPIINEFGSEAANDNLISFEQNKILTDQRADAPQRFITGPTSLNQVEGPDELERIEWSGAEESTNGEQAGISNSQSTLLETNKFRESIRTNVDEFIFPYIFTKKINMENLDESISLFEKNYIEILKEKDDSKKQLALFNHVRLLNANLGRLIFENADARNRFFLKIAEILKKASVNDPLIFNVEKIKAELKLISKIFSGGIAIDPEINVTQVKGKIGKVELKLNPAACISALVIFLGQLESTPPKILFDGLDDNQKYGYLKRMLGNDIVERLKTNKSFEKKFNTLVESAILNEKDDKNKSESKNNMLKEINRILKQGK